MDGEALNMGTGSKPHDFQVLWCGRIVRAYISFNTKTKIKLFATVVIRQQDQEFPPFHAAIHNLYVMQYKDQDQAVCHRDHSTTRPRVPTILCCNPQHNIIPALCPSI
jgi:hypothetical protein